MAALQVLHRTVVNEHGAVSQVGRLMSDAHTRRVWIDLACLDDGGEPTPGTENGVDNFEG